MKFVRQTDFTFTTGNCFSACLASLLEIQLSDVPTFCAMKNWQLETNVWLRKFGFQYLDVPWISACQEIAADLPCIVTGPSPRDKEKLHCVVGHLQHTADRIACIYDFDPHPSDKFLLDVKFIGFLIPLRHCVEKEIGN